MANRRELTAVSPDKLGKLPGFTRVERHSALFPKRTVKAGEARALAKRSLAATAAQAEPGKQPGETDQGGARHRKRAGEAARRPSESAGSAEADRPEAHP